MEDIISFYTAHSDDERLYQGLGMLEFARSKEILLRHLPEPPATVLDVGGGTGVYSEWLGELGYDAHLIDIAPSHIASARAKRTRLASAEVGDARKLPWQDASAGVVLLLGPLYHLTKSADRIQALREAGRVLCPGGLLFAAAICRFAPLLASLVEGFFEDPAFAPVLARDLQDGQHRNTTGNPARFTTAFFHRPEELTAELRQAGLQVVEVVPVEGPCWMARGSLAGFAAYWSDAERREKLMALARDIERDPMALAVSPHLMAVGRVVR
jgi:ubiquinone/menaquinone biosynthesis C-methylase UbiE